MILIQRRITNHSVHCPHVVTHQVIYPRLDTTLDASGTSVLLDGTNYSTPTAYHTSRLQKSPSNLILHEIIPRSMQISGKQGDANKDSHLLHI